MTSSHYRCEQVTGPGGEGRVVQCRQAVWEECLLPRLDPEEGEGSGEERGRGRCDFTQDAAVPNTGA
jgi:hypothetical protein